MTIGTPSAFACIAGSSYVGFAVTNLRDRLVRARMAEVLAEFRAGLFANELRKEEKSGYERLEKARAEARSTAIEKTYRRLSGEDRS